MNCLYLILLTLATAMCLVAYFYKPWDKPVIIFVILIAVSAICILISCVEVFFALSMMAKYSDKLLLDPYGYESYGRYSGIDRRMMKLAYYFAFVDLAIGCFNLVGSIIGILIKKRTIYLIFAIALIIEILVILMGILFMLIPFLR